MPGGSFHFHPPDNDTLWETVCCRAMARELGVTSLQKFKRRGQKQHGIDLIGTDAEGNAVVVQCKLRNTEKGLTRADAEDDVEAAKGLIDDETGERVHISRFVIATTDDVNDHTPWAANVTREHIAAGLFEVKVYAWCDFRTVLNNDSELRHWYLGLACSNKPLLGSLAGLTVGGNITIVMARDINVGGNLTIDAGASDLIPKQAPDTINGKTCNPE